MRDNLRVKEIAVEGADVRFIICHNSEPAERDRTQREDAITRLEAELARIKQARERDRTKNANDKVKQQDEARLDGKYLLATSDPHISAEGHHPGLQEPP